MYIKIIFLLYLLQMFSLSLSLVFQIYFWWLLTQAVFNIYKDKFFLIFEAESFSLSIFRKNILCLFPQEQTKQKLLMFWVFPINILNRRTDNSYTIF